MIDRINKTDRNNIAKLREDKGFVLMEGTLSPEQKEEISNLMKNKEKEMILSAMPINLQHEKLSAIDDPTPSLPCPSPCPSP